MNEKRKRPEEDGRSIQGKALRNRARLAGRTWEEQLALEDANMVQYVVAPLDDAPHRNVYYLLVGANAEQRKRWAGERWPEDRHQRLRVLGSDPEQIRGRSAQIEIVPVDTDGRPFSITVTRADLEAVALANIVNSTVAGTPESIVGIPELITAMLTGQAQWASRMIERLR